MTAMNAALFLDRDGVIIENREDYVKHWGEVEFLPGALEALERTAAAEMPVVIVTNQSAVGRGILTEMEAWAIQRCVVQEVERCGGRILASYLCVHHPKAECVCRKPAPGMLLQAAREHALDLSASYLVGDALSDIEAAEAAGATGVLVRTGRGERQAALVDPSRTLRIEADLAAAVEWILSQKASLRRESVGEGC